MPPPIPGKMFIGRITIVGYPDLIEPLFPHDHPHPPPKRKWAIREFIFFSKKDESEPIGTVTSLRNKSHWNYISSSNEVINEIYSVNYYANLTIIIIIKINNY